MRGLASLLLAAAVTQAVVFNTKGNLKPQAKRTVQARGSDPLYEYDSSTSAWCSWWWDNEDDTVSCHDIPNYWAVTEDQWKRWNPIIAQSCDNYKTGRSYCVDASSEPTGPITSKPATSSLSTTTKFTSSSTPATTTKPSNGIATPSPYMPGSAEDCDAFYEVQDGDLCEPIAKKFGISPAQFFKWNPNVGGTQCTGLWLNTYVCVSVIGVEPTPTTSKPSNGVVTPTPYMDGSVDNCDDFYRVKSGDLCEPIAKSHGASLDQFLRWNPRVGGKDCTNLQLDTYVCVSVIGVEPTTTSSNPGNGIVTPTPYMDGSVNNCDSFYKIKSGDLCEPIATSHGASLAQFLQWNPKVGGKECTNLLLDTYVCVSIIGVTPTKGNGISTPTPTQPGMVSNCDAFYKVQSGDLCEPIAKKHGASLAQFLQWNPQVGGTQCNKLQLNTYVCVSVIGVDPTPTQPGNGVATPTPYQDGMTKSCKSFHYIASGQNCDYITKRYNIPMNKFINWNPAAKRDCTGLFAKTYCCVAVL